jgi:hypothetical protein
MLFFQDMPVAYLDLFRMAFTSRESRYLFVAAARTASVYRMAAPLKF